MRLSIDRQNSYAISLQLPVAPFVCEPLPTAPLLTLSTLSLSAYTAILDHRSPLCISHYRPLCQMGKCQQAKCCSLHPSHPPPPLAKSVGVKLVVLLYLTNAVPFLCL